MALSLHLMNARPLDAYTKPSFTHASHAPQPPPEDDCNGSGAQLWSYNAATGDVVNRAANKCLDVTDNSSANGARAQIWSCTGAANQKWRLQ